MPTLIMYPDVSQYNGDISVPGGTYALCARATLSASVRDTQYVNNRARAASAGVFFFAYHWMNHGNIAAQVQWCWNIVGITPLMLDVEDVPNNTGYAGAVTVGDILEFVKEWRSRGGVCNMVYLPHWYWQGHMGSPDLTPLSASGLHLVASEYRSVAGPWPLGYGGMTPEVWQFTSTAQWGGSNSVDINAYQGTKDQFIAMVKGENDMTPEEHQMLQDLHDRSNWAVTPLSQVTGTTLGHPLEGSLIDLAAKSVSGGGSAPTAAEIATELAKTLIMPTAQDVAKALVKELGGTGSATA